MTIASFHLAHFSSPTTLVAYADFLGHVLANVGYLRTRKTIGAKQKIWSEEVHRVSNVEYQKFRMLNRIATYPRPRMATYPQQGQQYW